MVAHGYISYNISDDLPVITRGTLIQQSLYTLDSPCTYHQLVLLPLAAMVPLAITLAVPLSFPLASTVPLATTVVTVVAFAAVVPFALATAVPLPFPLVSECHFDHPQLVGLPPDGYLHKEMS